MAEGEVGVQIPSLSRNSEAVGLSAPPTAPSISRSSGPGAPGFPQGIPKLGKKPESCDILPDPAPYFPPARVRRGRKGQRAAAVGEPAGSAKVKLLSRAQPAPAVTFILPDKFRTLRQAQDRCWRYPCARACAELAGTALGILSYPCACFSSPNEPSNGGPRALLGLSPALLLSQVIPLGRCLPQPQSSTGK